ncbi:MAG: zinc ABC transporter substrate-binding protein [Candidatus Abyssobacteria bacterium SURF_17]|uniref:Zinc ABC transporter substrate-binding protein n=1 Tax=Candidatus Abyssobacteria bacterium SURF_17 TaxID=2093361 RepID=A0A419EWZ8_9BACT|nr:MAG: zinc ABC transporter substrate-binding protein [Candidatus Abyssubacteria bacterium SURF_17]
MCGKIGLKGGMRTAMKGAFSACVLVLLLSLHVGCSGEPQSTGRIKVAATVFPLYDIAQNVVGDRGEVLVLLPPGASPHTYDLTPQQARQLKGVRVVFKVGHGLDDWTRAIGDIWPGVETVVVDKGIVPRLSNDSEEHDESAEHAHMREEMNPHYWLSVRNGEMIAKNIAEEMIRIDPAHEASYSANAERYLAKLSDVKQEIEAQLSGLPNKRIVTFHDAWGYFADEFGLEIVATFEPFPGKQPTPRYLAELQRRVRKLGIKVIFSEPQLSTETIAPFVEDMGLKLYVLDPLGGVEGRNTYIELLRYNAQVIAEALNNGRR